MVVLRTWMQWAFLLSWSVFWISVAIVLRIVTLSSRSSLWLARTVWAPGVLWCIGASLRVQRAAGAEHIPWDQPHVFVMNHQSLIDIVVAFVVLRCPLRFIAKRELAWLPFLGWYMWATGMIFVDRSRPAKAVASLAQAAARVRAGASIIAFPEGTRTRTGAIGHFKKGIFHVAVQAGVPIVPMTIAGAQHVLPSGSMTFRRGIIQVVIGAPIHVHNLSAEQLMQATRAAMVSTSM